MKLKLAVIALSFLAISCGPNEQEQKRIEKGESVMAIHDDVMPQMGVLTKKRSEIKDAIQQLKADTTQPFDSAWEEKAVEVMVKLQKANDDMMDWMHEYRYPDDKVSFDDAMTYMEEQHQAISDVRDQTEQAIKDADEILKQAAEKAHNHENE